MDLKRYIPHIIIAILILAIVVQCAERNGEHKDLDKIRKENIKLEKENDSLQNEYDISKKSDKALQKKYDSLQAEKAIIDEKIIIIREKANEKINNVDNYTIGEQQEYFTKRYKR